MKQTAVEWLEEQIEKRYGLTPTSILLFRDAKEMEKEQIVDFAYVIADDLACGVFRDKKAMEKRYNEFLTYDEEKKQ